MKFFITELWKGTSSNTEQWYKWQNANKGSEQAPLELVYNLEKPQVATNYTVDCKQVNQGCLQKLDSILTG